MLEDLFSLGKDGAIPYLPFIEKIEDYDQVRIFRLKGSMDMSTLPEFRKMIPAAKENHGPMDRDIILDCKNVAHVDSAAIAVLLLALSELKSEHRCLALVNVQENLKDMLAFSEVKDLFSIYNSVEEALEQLSSSPE